MNEDDVILVSQEGQEFKIEYKALKLIPTAHNIVLDSGTGIKVPVPIQGKILQKCVEYCQHHANDVKPEQENKSANPFVFSEWDVDFMKINVEDHVQLISAANYLAIPNLLDLAVKTMAKILVSKGDPKNIKEFFGVKREFTPEEYEAVRKENKWCEER